MTPRTPTGKTTVNMGLTNLVYSGFADPVLGSNFAECETGTAVGDDLGVAIRYRAGMVPQAQPGK